MATGKLSCASIAVPANSLQLTQHTLHYFLHIQMDVKMDTAAVPKTMNSFFLRKHQSDPRKESCMLLTITPLKTTYVRSYDSLLA
jgi:hypothetical protein